MELHNETTPLPPHAEGATFAIGNFDGVHLGHRHILATARDIARQSGAPFGVVTFAPHPRAYFAPLSPPFHLCSDADKRVLLEKAGVEHLVTLTFDKNLAAMKAEEFIQDILINHLKARHIVVGEGFHFGYQKGGSTQTLKSATGFATTVVTKEKSDSDTISSSRIRHALSEADFKTVHKLLGRPWHFTAPVIHGDKRGRDLGYPTANQHLGEYQNPPYGVYAVRAQFEDNPAFFDGVANFGVRPMFKVKTPLFETYLFDWDMQKNGEFYGKSLRIFPVAYLRPEKAFSGLEALKLQIKQDCLDAAAVLKSSL